VNQSQEKIQKKKALSILYGEEERLWGKGGIRVLTPGKLYDEGGSKKKERFGGRTGIHLSNKLDTGGTLSSVNLSEGGNVRGKTYLPSSRSDCEN